MYRHSEILIFVWESLTKTKQTIFLSRRRNFWQQQDIFKQATVYDTMFIIVFLHLINYIRKKVLERLFNTKQQGMLTKYR